MQPVQQHPPYMAQLSAAFANMANVKLLVEGQPLPAHSMILAANSKVFAEMFTKATAQQSDSNQKLEVPLPGDSLKDVSTALDYLYKGCTVWLATTL